MNEFITRDSLAKRDKMIKTKEEKLKKKVWERNNLILGSDQYFNDDNLGTLNIIKHESFFQKT